MGFQRIARNPSTDSSLRHDRIPIEQPAGGGGGPAFITQQGTLTIDDQDILFWQPLVTDPQGSLDVSDSQLFWQPLVTDPQGSLDVADAYSFGPAFAFIAPQGTLDLDDTSLFYRPFRQAQGTVNVDDTQLFYRPWRQDQGSLDVADEDVLRYVPFVQAQGSLDINDSQLFYRPFAQTQGSLDVGDVDTLFYRPWRQDQGALNVDDTYLFGPEFSVTTSQGTLNVDDTQLFWRPFTQTQGSLDVADEDVLRYVPFTPAVFGTLDIADEDVLRWTRFVPAITGTLDISEPGDTLFWRPFAQTQGTLDVAQATDIALIEWYATSENEESGSWDNAGAATGRPNSNAGNVATTRDSTGNNSTAQTLALVGNFSNPGTTGWSLLRDTPIIVAAWDNALAVGVGEDYNVRCGVNFGTRRDHHTAQAVASDHMDADEYAPLDCVSDTPAIRADIDLLGNTQAGLRDFLDETVLEFDHDKAGIGNGGRMGVDGMALLCFAYAGTQPTVHGIHDFSAGDWNEQNLVSDNNRIENSSAVAVATGIYTPFMGRSFDVLWRCGSARPAAGTNTVNLLFWADNTVPGDYPRIEVRFGTSATNDRLVVPFVGSPDITVDPNDFGGGWQPSTATTPPVVGNMFRIQVRYHATDSGSATEEGHLRVWWHRGPGVRHLLVNQVIVADANNVTTPGHVGVRFSQPSGQNQWIDDLTIVGVD